LWGAVFTANNAELAMGQPRFGRLIGSRPKLEAESPEVDADSPAALMMSGGICTTTRWDLDV